MAKYTYTYEISLGDVVDFYLPFALPTDPSYMKKLQGKVQDISCLPEVVVEVGDPRQSTYKRYRTSLRLIERNYTKEYFKYGDVKFENNEPLEYVYNEEYKTKIINTFKE